jgi:hypothetical protein
MRYIGNQKAKFTFRSENEINDLTKCSDAKIFKIWSKKIKDSIKLEKQVFLVLKKYFNGREVEISLAHTGYDFANDKITLRIRATKFISNPETHQTDKR